MSTGRRSLGLALIALCALAGSRAGGAEAEGSGLDGEGLAASREVDERGLSLLVPARKRSPGGILYPYPFAPPAWTDTNGIEWRGSADLGYLANADRDHETRFEEYVDWSDGLLLRDFSLDARSAQGLGYASFSGGSVGRDDAFYRAEAGIRGWLKLGLFYDQVPHVLANDARSLYQGIGHESLTLPAPLVAGGTGVPATDQALVDGVLAGIGERTLEIERDRAGAALSLRATPELTLSGSYRRERRTGERPFGGSVSFVFPDANLGAAIETIEPIDSITHDFGGGLQWAGRGVQANLVYRGSAFENQHESLTWENPFSGADGARGRTALAPANFSNLVHGDLALALPLQGRWTASAAWNRMRQNDELVLPTINPNYPAWTGPDSLSRHHADALVQTWLFDTSLQFRPLRPLSARVHLRYFERNNETDYEALNPLLSGHGYVAEDGNFGEIPRFAPVPFDHARALGEASVVWRAPFGANFELEYTRDEMRREQRASDTHEDIGRASLTSRRLGPATLRVAYELRKRNGGPYDVTHDAVWYSVGPFGGYAPAPDGTPLSSLREFRQLDLSDRLQRELQVRLRLALGESVDVSLASLFRDADYDSDYGRDFDRGHELNLDLGWQPSPRLELHAFGSAERRRGRLDSIDSTLGATAPFTAGSAAFPFANAWSTDTEGNTLGAGIGFRARPVPRLELMGDYTWLRSRDERDYTYASDAALAANTTGADAGSGLPALRTADQVLRLAAELKLDARWSARVFYRLEHSRLEDPQQTGLVPRIRQLLYLGHIDENFNAQVFGGSLTLTF